MRPHEVQTYRVGSDLAFAVNGTPGKLTVPGWFDEERGFSVLFEHDGTLWSARDVRAMAETRDPDILYHVVSNDEYVRGGDGSDRLQGRDDQNTLFLPGGGDDAVTFGGKGNTLYYRMGEGSDVITIIGGESSHKGVRFHNDVTKNDVSAYRSGDDMVISVGTGSIRVKDWYASLSNRIDVIEFWGEDVWDALDVEKLASNQPLTAREIVMTYDERFNAGSGGNGGNPAQGGGGCNVIGAAAVMLLAFPAVAMWRRGRRSR